MQTFSTRAAARILAVSPDRIRYWVKRRLVQPAAAQGRRYRFAFNDLLMLRMAKELLPGHRPVEPLRRCFERVRSFFGPGRTATSLALRHEDGRIVVRDGAVLIEAESGQLVLRFDARPAGTVEDGFGPARIRARFEEARQVAAADPVRALTLYNELIGREPRNVEANLRIAALLEERGQTAEALGHLLAAAVAEPASAEVHLRLGRLYRRRGENESALQSMLRAAACDPQLAEAHRTLAELYDEAGRARDALRHLSALRRIDRETPS